MNHKRFRRLYAEEKLQVQRRRGRRRAIGVRAPLVLAPLAEEQLRTGLMASGGTFWAILDRPIALAFVAIAIAMLLWPMCRVRVARV
jgi:TctA family transporter